MNNKLEKLTFELDDGTSVDFYIEEEARVNGVDYLLVTESEDEEAEALILKDVSAESETEARFEIVEDETELEALAKVFQEMLDDVDIV
ncbi:MAG: DUF1292 domain-containing protein [Lachnospiraceae bacterium]|nr:DUF1292 domain-containing protein [Lachnospiraceae bacterium]